MYEVEHVVNVQNILGEGPLWHPTEQMLYWVDIDRGELFRLNPNTDNLQKWAIGEKVGCIGLRAQGGLVMGLVHSVASWTPEAGCTTLVEFQQSQVGERFNDGAVDPGGRLWVGSKDDPGNGFLYRVDADHSIHAVQDHVAIGNGIGWSPDHRTMYFTDSLKYAIFAYDYDPATGHIENRREFVNVQAENAGVPDGLTVDQEGCIWSARWDGWKIVRYDPNGAVMREIRMPVQRPTSCMFGGPEYKTLYITSARTDLSAAELAQQPQAGDVFRVSVEVGGVPEFMFAG